MNLFHRGEKLTIPAGTPLKSAGTWSAGLNRSCYTLAEKEITLIKDVNISDDAVRFREGRLQWECPVKNIFHVPVNFSLTGSVRDGKMRE